jgi:enoyl-CoA hydratase/carnithine racemase
VTKLSEYENKYECIKFERRDGILQMTVHTAGGSLRWGLVPHREYPAAFYDVANDAENKVVIFTGTGDEFSGPQVIPSEGHPIFPTRPSMELVDTLLSEGKQGLLNFLHIDVPVITAFNGPAWRHGEIPLLADIIIAADTVAFQDSAHFQGGLVPGDGVHVVYPLLLGMNRARYFLITGQIIRAKEAKELGLVNEVLPQDQVLPRAWELAREMAKKPKSLLRATRIVLTEKLKRETQDMMSFGLHAELLALQDRPN